jgi:aspartate/methionine/tyrosine aminotransferase
MHDPPRHYLGTSSVPIPPADFLDASGPALLFAEGKAERLLTERLAERYRARPEDVVLTSGVSEGIYLAAAAAIEPGDAVLVESPCYQSLAAVPRALGAEVWPLPRGLDGALDLEAARAALRAVGIDARAAGRRLAAVFVSDLHNPTGARLEDAVLDALAEACRREGAHLVIDEVYRDADAGRAVGSARDRHADVTVLSSFTKSYGLGGLRLGWMLAPEALAAPARRVQHYLSVLPAAPSIGLGLRVLDAADGILARWRPALAANRAALAAALAARPGGFVLPAAGACGTIAFPHRPGGPDTRAEAQRWLADRGLAVVPGAFFGAPSGIRVGLGLGVDSFAEALGEWLAAVREGRGA